MNTLSRKHIDTHISLVGWLQIADGLITLLAAAFIVAVLLTVGSIARDPTAYSFLATLGWLTGGLLFILALPGLVAGIGLLTRGGWSRVMAMVVAVFQLALFPLGTLLGAYTLFVLVQDASEDAFRPRPAPQGNRLQTVGT